MKKELGVLNGFFVVTMDYRAREKGFVEQNKDARPKEYKAFSLKDTTEKIAALRTREIVGLCKSMDKLNRALEVVAPIHRQYETYRLFAPRYRTWKKAKLKPLNCDPTSSEVVLPCKRL